MRQQIQTWSIRVFSAIIIVLAVMRWGPPLYRQYFAPKKAAVYVPTAVVREGEFVVSFHEIGTLQAENSVPISTETGGKIITLVPDGKTVRAGDLLVMLDTTDLEKDVRNKQLTYGNAKADLDKANEEFNLLKESNATDQAQAQAQLEYDKNELELAKKELDKQTRLAKDKLVPLSDVDKADLQVRSKNLAVLKGEKSLALKQHEVRSKEAQKKADVRNVEFRVTMAKIDLEDAQNRVKKAVIKAPADGLVVISKDWTPDGRRKLKEGDSCHPRQTICELPDLSKMLIKVQVGEADAPKVRANLPVLIRLEAVPNKVYHGMVQDISSLATEASPWETTSTPGKRNFEVTIEVKESDRRTIKPGMTADVEFLCDVLNRAVYLPLEAVTERDDKTYVFVKEKRGWRKTIIKTGKSNDNFVCVTSGLGKDRVVALRDPTRPLEEQEAGTAASDSGKKKDENRAPPTPASKR